MPRGGRAIRMLKLSFRRADQTRAHIPQHFECFIPRCLPPHWDFNVGFGELDYVWQGAIAGLDPSSERWTCHPSLTVLFFFFFFSKSRPDHTWPDLDGILVSPTFPHIQTLNCTFGTLRNKSSRSLKILKF